MGKTGKTSYQGGSVSINGQNKASSYMQNGTVHTNYNMSDAEKSAYEYAQNEFAKNLPQINVFSKDTLNNLNSQLGAYTQKGQKLISDTYTPMLNSLKTDIASRFGNFDNSSFLNKLNAIETNRANAINALAQDVMAKRNELYNNELANRYEYLNYMNNIQNQAMNNAMNYMNMASQNSAAGNEWARANAAASGGGMFENLASALLSSNPYTSAASKLLK